ncbi:calcitonin gene-related peptide type 1 receptor isoform X4 [Ctenopharyngodon idella]|uniref:calcitonin gene-related peptide type 1 receptor isoform X4 n=1 Tax=Ctenopharyngodon idella TaxID=7959 RepID=UPI00222E7FA9|nr:calcitonin gene-related peptide type 1 receptor isoform X4 [Ctenopharyngodon idella]
MGWQETLWLLTSFILSVTKAGTTETKAEPTTDLSLTPVMMAVEGERLIMTQSQYKCLELLSRDGSHNKTGLFCSRFWDGLLCWDETPAGTFASQNCPDYPSFDPLEKVTKYCDESGNWVHSSSVNKTWSHCLTFSKEKIKTLPVHGFLETETDMDPTAESQVSPVVTQKAEERKKIIDGQYKCFEKMNRDQPYNKSGLYCNRTWDGWLCWDDTPAGTYTSQYCPNYFPDFDSTEKVTKYCDETGNWFRHPETNRTWSNYTLCIAHTKDKLKESELSENHSTQELILLVCAQLSLHHRQPHNCGQQPQSGAEESGFPLVPASIHAVARKKYFDDNCWMSVETHLLYVVHGPIMAALLVNLFFLLNIVRVLVTKLRDTHRAESNMYMKAVRATLILVPLLGIQFVIFPWRPENRLAGEIYDYIMHILMHYQGLLVATIFCFFNGEVQGALKRQWMQYKAQWGQRRREHCSMRSTSYTATSITEVPAFMYHHDCNSEHLNGKQTEDSELVALKMGETYA